MPIARKLKTDTSFSRPHYLYFRSINTRRASKFRYDLEIRRKRAEIEDSERYFDHLSNEFINHGIIRFRDLNQPLLP